jgi:hypothetical protein
MLSIGVTS